jgi:Leucine-rich repeat (LRR) protein
MNIIAKEAIIKKQCTWLSLKNNNITSVGLSIIADGLDENESLESLYLSQNQYFS